MERHPVKPLDPPFIMGKDPWNSVSFGFPQFSPKQKSLGGRLYTIIDGFWIGLALRQKEFNPPPFLNNGGRARKSTGLVYNGHPLIFELTVVPHPCSLKFVAPTNWKKCVWPVG